MDGSLRLRLRHVPHRGLSVSRNQPQPRPGDPLQGVPMERTRLGPDALPLPDGPLLRHVAVDARVRQRQPSRAPGYQALGLRPYLSFRMAGPAEDLRREVESLLASDRADGTVLDHPAWERRLSPGECIGPYQIVSRIGAGGMGEVWKARDTRLGREVAIKVCSSRFSDRFKREARAIAALNHPHICTLFDVGADCLVMEYIEGKPVQGPLHAGKDGRRLERLYPSRI